MRGRLAVVPVLLLTLLLVFLYRGSTSTSLILATTTSLEDSGFLEQFLTELQEETGIRVSVISVGTGQALAIGRRGDAHLLLVHDPQAEDEFMVGGYGVWRQEIMEGRFILVGPSGDPARIQGLPIPDALSTLAESGATFVSRGDGSGTHSQELALWSGAGLVPAGSWYLSAGQGMASTLRLASERGAYTLTDEATFLLWRHNLDLASLVPGEPHARNVYSLIATAEGARARPDQVGAIRDFALSDRGRQIMVSFGLDRHGVALFRPLDLPPSDPVTEPGPGATTGTVRGILSVLDRELLGIVLRSLWVSGMAVVLASLVGVPLGAYLAVLTLSSRRRTVTVVKAVGQALTTLWAVPPVIIGLGVYLLLSARGPLGPVRLLYTPAAMILAQFLLALPMVAGLTMSGVQSRVRRVTETAVSLGASARSAIFTLVFESRLPIVAAVLAGFGRIVGEVGAVMMVGGNIQNQTRVMTTAILLETRQGDFARALVLGGVLLFVSLAVNVLVYTRYREGGGSR